MKTFMSIYISPQPLDKTAKLKGMDCNEDEYEAGG